MTTLLVLDRDGDGTEIRLAPGERATLWPGSPPLAPVLHAAVAKQLGAGRILQEPSWLESRPVGARLDRVPELSPAQAAHVLLDVARGLRALHQAGRVHGGLSASAVVVDHSGQAVLIGVGRTPAIPDHDITAFRSLMGAIWPAQGPPPPDPGPEPARVQCEALVGWLEEEASAFDAATLGVLAKRHTLEHVESTLDWQEAGFMDEVGLDWGTDGGRGVLDRWATRSGSLPGAITGAMEGTQPGTGEDLSMERIALLARLLSPPDQAPDPARFEAIEGTPLQALKALIAEEPLDPVPMEAGVQAVVAPDTPVVPRQEEVSSRMLSSIALAALAAVMVVGALVLALFFS